MKYSTKIKQAQYVGKVKIEPQGGDLSNAQVKEIMADKYGQSLISKGMLTIQGAGTTETTDGESEKGK